MIVRKLKVPGIVSLASKQRGLALHDSSRSRSITEAVVEAEPAGTTTVVVNGSLVLLLTIGIAPATPLCTLVPENSVVAVVADAGTKVLNALGSGAVSAVVAVATLV